MPAQLAVSLRTLLQGSLDYAGMFPPARLPLDEAWAKYLEAHASPYRWLLRSFVCPIGQLDALAQLWAATPAPLARFTAIGTPPDAGLKSQAADASLLAAFYRRVATEAGPPVELSYEVRPPAAATADAAAWTAYCNAMDAALRQAEVPLSEIFIEVTLEPQRLASLSPPATDSCWSWGLKFRTGGLTADAFPTAETLAGVVAAMATGFPPPQTQDPCSTALRRYKATAGLHHPLPLDAPELGATMHGFINLFVAAVLASSTASAHDAIGNPTSSSLQPADPQVLVQAILQERDPQAFRFDERQLCWRDRCASLAVIARARRFHLLGFGSCSFDEPVADLQSLGWI